MASRRSRHYHHRPLSLQPLELRRMLDAGGLLAHWSFDTPTITGDTLHDTANHSLGPFDGTKTNAGPTTGIPGVLGQAANFAGGPSNGNHPFVDLSAHADQFGTLAQGTIAAWINPSTTDLATDVLTIFAVSNQLTGSEEMRFWVSNTPFSFGVGTLAYGVRAGGVDGNVISSSANLLDGNWHHVAVSVTSDNTAQLYIDGQPDGPSASVSFLTNLNANSAALGRNKDNTAGGGQWFFDGNMDDAGLWDVSLSQAKIRSLVEFAQAPTLQYNQSDVAQLFELFDTAGASTTIDQLNWNYVPSGLPGEEGQLLALPGGNFSINLDNGAGLSTGTAPVTVTTISPADGAFFASPPTQVTIDFSHPLNAASISAQDLQINGVAANAVSQIDADTLQFDITGLTQPRTNTIVLPQAGLQNTAGGQLLQFSSTFIVPEAPALQIDSATNVGPNLATLRGELLDTGSQAPEVVLYWGTTDGGTDMSQWSHSRSLGNRDLGAFATSLNDLSPLTTYYYRAAARNLGGTTWTPTAASFTTTAIPSLVISEFMADNDQTLRDEDGDASDWIEIFNPNPYPVDLSGWYLTDRANDLDKWRFPSRVIDSLSHLVVFASSKNRTPADPQLELHTNFALSNSGEYVGLIQPDGLTIASQHGTLTTNYPSQLPDVSYGYPQSATTSTWIDTDTTASLLVPTSAALGDTWTSRSFNDASWDDVVLPIGYDTSNQAPGLIAYWPFDTDASSGDTISDSSGSSLAGLLVGNAATTGGVLELDGSGDYVELADVDALEGLPQITIATWVRADSAPTALRRLLEHEDVFYFWAENNRFRFTVHGAANQAISTSAVPVGEWVHVVATSNGVLGQIYVNGVLEGSAGLTAMPTSPFPLQIGARRSAGGPATNFWDGALDDMAVWDRVLSPSEIAQLASGTKPNSIGSLATGITTDVGATMAGINASAYLRIPFTAPADPSAIDQLILQANYDDGFVAYLNGQQIASFSAPDTLAWNSEATTSLAEPAMVSVDISSAISRLVPGENVLAIQLLNASAADADLFFSVQLQAVDFSSTDTSAPQYFSPATPGAINGTGYSSVTTEQVTFSHPSRTITEAISLELTTTAPAGQIHYTLDGSIPDASSPIYTAPLAIGDTIQVRARVIEPDSVPGPLAAASFVRLGTDIEDFTSPLPIVVLENFDSGPVPNKRAGNPPAGDGSGIVEVPRQMAFLSIFEGANRSSLQNIPTLTSRSGIRVRGASSANFNKQSYSLETWGTGDDDSAVSPFGMPDESDWVLYGPSTEFDWSLIHNSLIYELSQQSGNYAPRFQFVELFLNTDGGDLAMSDYQGLYLFMEKIKDDAGRVDIEDMSGDGTTGGWMLQSDRLQAVPEGETEHPPAIHTRGPNRIQEGPYGGSAAADRGGDDIPTGYNTFLNFESPAGPEINDRQIETIASWLDEFEDALYGPNFTDPVTGYRAYIDTQSFIDHLLLNNLPKNRDGLQLSTYMYRRNENDKMHLGPIWDFDRAFESNSFGGGATGSLTWGQQFLWMPRLFQDPDFAQEYIDRYQELRTDVFSIENMFQVIDAQVAEITQEVATRNGTTNWSQRVQATKDWIAQRVAALDALYVAAPTLDRTGGEVTPGTELRITAPRGTVYYTTDGSDPRLPGGTVSPAALTLGAAQTTTLVAANAPAVAIVPTAEFHTTHGMDWTGSPANEPYDDSAAAGWISGTSGIGYDEATEYQSLIGLNLISQMNDINASLYARIEFQITGPVPQLDLLTLRMQYDDGFIAYLNGVEIARKNAPATPTWNSESTGEQPDTSAVVFEAFDVTPYLDQLRSGTNVLAIHGLNRLITSSDMLIRPELVGSTLTDATITLDATSHIVARALDGTNWSGPASALFTVDAPPSLRITEVNYHPATAANTEFIEVENIGTEPLPIAGFRIRTDVGTSSENDAFVFPARTLAAGERALVVADLPAFQAAYPTVSTGVIAGVMTGALSNGGERLQLLDAVGRVIVDLEYADDDPWPLAADGAGTTLELVDPTSTTSASAGKYYRWQSSQLVGGTPGAAASAPLGIVINEVLANTNDVSGSLDAIELWNSTSGPVDLTGWYLSDSADQPLKFAIPSGTILAPGAYLVFDEHQFNPTPATPGPNDFALNGAEGDQVWLTKTDGQGTITHVVDSVEFRASFEDQSLGRVADDSAPGTGRLVPQSLNTLGCANAQPAPASLIITELHYHPVAPTPEQLAIDPTLDANDLEFIELQNTSLSVLDLTNWRIRGGIDFDFPAGRMLQPGEVIVVSSFDPAAPGNAAKRNAFLATHNTLQSQLVGGYSGRLSDNGELIRVERPDSAPPDDPGLIPRVTVDEVLYDNLAPWPVPAAGQGSSLVREFSLVHGVVTQNWSASAPSPGTALLNQSAEGDFNGDSQIDARDIDLLFSGLRNSADLMAFDLTGDGALTSADADYWVEDILNTRRGDANLDGVVDAVDFNIWNAHRFQRCGTWSTGDFTGDGSTDVRDFQHWNANKFQPPSPQ